MKHLTLKNENTVLNGTKKTNLFQFFLKKQIILDFTLLILLLGCQNLFAIVYINSTVVWNSSSPPPSGVADGIVVQPGGDLTIDGLTITIAHKIYVSPPTTGTPGGHLTILNSTIKNHFSGTLWDGIEVEGDQSYEQLITVTDKSSPFTNAKWEGTLDPDMPSVIISNSTIEKATYGVKALYGGIIRTSNLSKFYDCPIGIYIYNYQSTANPAYNACYIMDTEFKWNVSTTNPPIGLQMQQVTGINVGGCTFVNDNPSALGYTDRGHGIKATDCDFNLSSGGNVYCVDAVNCLDNCVSTSSGNGNNFKKLSYGIEASGQHLSVRNSIFNSCLYSLKASGYTSVSIANNIFYATIYVNIPNKPDMVNIFLSTFVPTDMRYDIYTENSKYVTIYKNTFELNNDYFWESSNIKVKDCGSQLSQIKDNDFTVNNMEGCYTHEVNAIDISGSCEGLHVLCNEFQRYGVDIRLRASASVTDLGTVQDAKPGKNKFSAPYTFGSCPRINLYLHSGATMGTYYYNNVSPGSDEIPSTNTGSTMMNSNSLNPSCAISCDDLMAVNIENQTVTTGGAVFPNPSNGEFVLQLLNNQTIDNVLIYNSLGQIIYKQNDINENSFKFVLQNLPIGVYYIVVSPLNSLSNFKTKILIE